MKYFIIIATFLFSACGVKRQISQIKALEDCRYEIASADSITIANVDVREFLGKEEVDLKKMPRLAFAFLRKNVPLKARLNLSIKNPSNQLAAINQFEYKVLVKNRELAGGFVNQKIAVSPNGGSTVVPILINSNIYEVLSDDKVMDAITDFFIGTNDRRKEKLGIITIKIKPTLDIGNRQVNYPGYITIDKEVSSKYLF